MCSFGLGIERTAAAYVERYLRRGDADEELIWSWNLSPFQLMIIGNFERGLEAYNTLRTHGYDVLIEDRDIRMSTALREGMKFGFPMYLIAGQRTEAGNYEFVCKRAGIHKEIERANLLEEIAAAKARLDAVELAEMAGKVIRIDDSAKQIYVEFPDAYCFSAPFYERFHVCEDLMGNFGRTAESVPAHLQRLRFGDYWVRPVVRSGESGAKFDVHDDVQYLRVGNSVSLTPQDICREFASAGARGEAEDIFAARQIA